MDRERRSELVHRQLLAAGHHDQDTPLHGADLVFELGERPGSHTDEGTEASSTRWASPPCACWGHQYPARKRYRPRATEEQSQERRCR